MDQKNKEGQKTHLRRLKERQEGAKSLQDKDTRFMKKAGWMNQSVN